MHNFRCTHAADYPLSLTANINLARVYQNLPLQCFLKFIIIIFNGYITNNNGKFGHPTICWHKSTSEEINGFVAVN